MSTSGYHGCGYGYGYGHVLGKVDVFGFAKDYRFRFGYGSRQLSEVALDSLGGAAELAGNLRVSQTRG